VSAVVINEVGETCKDAVSSDVARFCSQLNKQNRPVPGPVSPLAPQGRRLPVQQITRKMERPEKSLNQRFLDFQEFK
jgi:hypothetical protein